MDLFLQIIIYFFVLPFCHYKRVTCSLSSFISFFYFTDPALAQVETLKRHGTSCADVMDAIANMALLKMECIFWLKFDGAF